MKRTGELILKRWGLTQQELTEVIDENPSLRGMILGYAAETKLKSIWFSGGKVSDVKKNDDHDRRKKGDVAITYKEHKFIIECKSLQTNSVKKDGSTWVGKAQVDASDKRKVLLPNGSKIETTCLKIDEFDLLAVNLFAFENHWKFIFAKNKDLPRSKWGKYTPYQQKFLLATMVNVTWPPRMPFREEPFSLLDEIIQERIV